MAQRRGHASVPLRFALAANSRPTSTSALTPCLVASLRGIPIYRILDAEFREPYISCSKFFAAADMTPLAGLFKFGLQPGDWDVNLAGLAPFDDMWVSLSTARHVAEALGFGDEMFGLLEWHTRFAWTVLDYEEDALRHNWRIPPNTLAEDRYSTSAMLETAFPAVVMLPKGHDVRTHIPAAPPPSTDGLSWEDQWRILVRWSLLLYEDFLDRSAGSDFGETAATSSPLASPPIDPSLVRSDERHVVDLLPSLLWSIIGNQIQLVRPDLVATFGDRGRAWTFAGGRLTARKAECDLGAQLALIDALAHLVLAEWHRGLQAQARVVKPEPPPPPPPSTPPPSLTALLDQNRERLDELESRLSTEQATLRESLDGVTERWRSMERRFDLLLDKRRATTPPRGPSAAALTQPAPAALLAFALGASLSALVAVVIGRWLSVR